MPPNTAAPSRARRSPSSAGAARILSVLWTEDEGKIVVRQSLPRVFYAGLTMARKSARVRLIRENMSRL